MTITQKVLITLRSSCNGLNAYQIGNAIKTDNSLALSSNICNMVKRGYLKHDITTTCDCCGASVYSYRITEKGRMKVSHL